MLDEKSLRKPTFTEGHWTELSDGQKYSFPKPRIKFRPKFVDGKVEIGGGATFGPEYDANLDILLGAVQVDGAERLRVKFEVAARLLRANYDLTDEQVSDLLEFDIDDEVSSGRYDRWSDIIMGITPKPLADTSAAPL
jgi:hypothetical protein